MGRRTNETTIDGGQRVRVRRQRKPAMTRAQERCFFATLAETCNVSMAAREAEVRGTEWASATHAVGEAFALVDPARLVVLPIARERVGATVTVTPAGLADETAETVSRVFDGEALRPPSPVHLAAALNDDGALEIAWIARSRVGWGWIDGHEPGPGETQVSYRTMLRGGGTCHEIATAQTKVAIDAATLANFGGEEITITVAMQGDLATSHPSTLTVQP